MGKKPLSALENTEVAVGQKFWIGLAVGVILSGPLWTAVIIACTWMVFHFMP